MRTSTQVGRMRQFVLAVALLGLIAAQQVPALAEDDPFEFLQMTRFEEPQEVPDFSLTAVDGSEKKLSDYMGNVIFLNFWTTW